MYIWFTCFNTSIFGLIHLNVILCFINTSIFFFQCPLMMTSVFSREKSWNSSLWVNFKNIGFGMRLDKQSRNTLTHWFISHLLQCATGMFWIVPLVPNTRQKTSNLLARGEAYNWFLPEMATQFKCSPSCGHFYSLFIIRRKTAGAQNLFAVPALFYCSLIYLFYPTGFICM